MSETMEHQSLEQPSNTSRLSPQDVAHEEGIALLSFEEFLKNLERAQNGFEQRVEHYNDDESSAFDELVGIQRAVSAFFYLNRSVERIAPTELEGMGTLDRLANENPEEAFQSQGSIYSVRIRSVIDSTIQQALNKNPDAARMMLYSMGWALDSDEQYGTFINNLCD